jgi:hypothetical protein
VLAIQGWGLSDLCCDHVLPYVLEDRKQSGAVVLFGGNVIDEDVVVALNRFAGLDHDWPRVDALHQHLAVGDLVVHVEGILEI